MELLRGLMVVGVLVLVGCPGSADMPPAPDDGGAIELPFYPYPDQGSPPGSDVTLGDGGPPGEGTTDLKVSTKAGDPCPCQAPLLCANGACRIKCTAQDCNGPGGCAATEACVKTQQNEAVCIPGAAKGAACDSSTVCAASLLCLADPQSAKGKCYATCQSAGSACGGGGKCFNLKGSTCLFCYP